MVGMVWTCAILASRCLLVPTLSPILGNLSEPALPATRQYRVHPAIPASPTGAKNCPDVSFLLLLLLLNVGCLEQFPLPRLVSSAVVTVAHLRLSPIRRNRHCGGYPSASRR